MVSSGEIIRKHCGHAAVCCSAIEAPPDAGGDGSANTTGAGRLLASTRMLSWSARGRITHPASPHSMAQLPFPSDPVGLRHALHDCQTGLYRPDLGGSVAMVEDGAAGRLGLTDETQS